MNELEKILSDPRVTVRSGGSPDPSGRSVVYWMQRAQGRSTIPRSTRRSGRRTSCAFRSRSSSACTPAYPGANLRHYAFCSKGSKRPRARSSAAGAAFIFRPYPRTTSWFLRGGAPGPRHRGREPPSRARVVAQERRGEAERSVVDRRCGHGVPRRSSSRRKSTRRALCARRSGPCSRYFFSRPKSPIASAPGRRRRGPVRSGSTPPRLLDSLPLDRGASAVSRFKGGTARRMRSLRLFIDERLGDYPWRRNLPEDDRARASSRLTCISASSAR